MAKLIIFLDGTIAFEHLLENKEKEYSIGRGTQCDIILAHPKVSRVHAKIWFNKVWHCKVVSKYGEVWVNGNKASDFDLSNGMTLALPPFEIRFLDLEDERHDTEVISEPTEKSPQVSDKTRVVSFTLKPVLRKISEDGSVLDEIPLATETLIAGRSPSCQILLQDDHASRKHFSISFEEGQYFITDLESANKTVVNGFEITQQVLESGDEISVGQDRYRFELVNPEFATLPAVVPEDSSLIPIQDAAVIKYNFKTGHQELTLSRIKNLLHSLNSTQHLPIKIAGLVGILGFIIYLALTSNHKGAESPKTLASQSKTTASVSSFERLSDEQKKFVESTYNLALDLYGNGKFDLALTEITKVLQVVSDYKDAKTMQAFCQQQLEIKKQQDDTDHQLQEQTALKQKVSDILDGCEELFKQKRYDKVSECTGKVSDLDPDNERASNLSMAARQALSEIENSKERRAELAHQKVLAEKHFNQAKKAFSEKRYPAALAELQKVERGEFEDSNALKEKAKQDITTVKALMLKESQTLMQQGKSALDARDYASALKHFDAALTLAPFNTKARDLKTAALRELHSEMKNIYSESVIEENLGNIESAKKKWQTIIKEDEKADPYYQKAQSKLRKYER